MQRWLALLLVTLWTVRADAFVCGYQVDSTADLPDAVPGNGVCAATGPSGPCTLRAAVEEADVTGCTVITLPPGLYAVSGEMLLTNSVAAELLIIAPSGLATISGNEQNRIFHSTGTRDVTLQNLSLIQGWAISGNGGAFWNEAVGQQLTVESCELSYNLSIRGGAIDSAGDVSINNSSITENTVDWISPYGGGVYVTGGGLVVTSSTIANNHLISSGQGAGLYLSNAGPPSFIIRSTIAGNTNGPGIRSVDSNLTLTYVTTTDSISHYSSDNSHKLSVGTSILDGSPNCVAPTDIVSLDYNVLSSTCAPFTASGDKQNSDPLLYALAYNGGTTMTCALPSGSPARDAGPPPAPGGQVDQRGISRIDSFTDAGAFEVNPVDLQLSSPFPVPPGNPHVNLPLTFTVRLTATGNAPATAVLITAPLPSGAQFVDVSSDTGACEFAANTFYCYNPSVLYPGTVITYAFTVRPTQLGPFSLVFTATHNEPDPNTGNDAVAFAKTIDPQSANLTLALAPSGDSVVVQNLGLDTAPNVHVVLTASTGTVSPSGYSFGDLTAAQSASGAITVDGSPGTTVTLTATVTSDLLDGDPSNNTTSVEIEFPAAPTPEPTPTPPTGALPDTPPGTAIPPPEPVASAENETDATSQRAGCACNAPARPADLFAFVLTFLWLGGRRALRKACQNSLPR